MSEPRLDSRPSSSDGFGKCDDRLDTPLPSKVKEEFAAAAVVQGYGSAAALNRALIEDYLYGRMHAIRVRLGVNPSDGRIVG